MPQLTDTELNTRLDRQVFPRVTREQIEGKIAREEYLHHGTMTIAVLTLENGFTVTGEAKCVDPRNYDEAIGKRVARDDAVRKVWPLEGYLLQERVHRGEVVA